MKIRDKIHLRQLTMDACVAIDGKTALIYYVYCNWA